jgi:protein TonB
VGKDGRIRAVRVVNGHPLLRQAAVDAVKQWIYTPSLLNGSPVEVVTKIEVGFNFQGN